MRRLLTLLLLLAAPSAFGQDVYPADSGAGTQGPPGSVSFPLQGPNGTEAAPTYSFSTQTDMGCFRGLAATWGYDSLVCQSENYGDYEGGALQLSSGPPNLFFLYATDGSANGATIFGQDPTAGGTPWATISLAAADFTTGTGADTSIGMTATTAGVGTIEVYAASNGAGDSTTTFASDRTTFTDRLLLPNGTSTAPAVGFTSNPTHGLYYSGGVSLRAWGAGSGSRFFTANASDSGQTGFYNYGSGTGDRSWVESYPGYSRMVYYDSNAQTSGVIGRLDTNGFTLSVVGGTLTPKFIAPGSTDSTPKYTFTGINGGLAYNGVNGSIDMAELDGNNRAVVYVDADDTFLGPSAAMFVEDVDGSGEIAYVGVAAKAGLAYAALNTDNNSVVVNEDQGVFFNTFSSKPTCSVTIRGSMWRTEGGAGVADSLEICAKNSSDTYAWYALTSVP